jgi:hypothetical protein
VGNHPIHRVSPGANSRRTNLIRISRMVRMLQLGIMKTCSLCKESLPLSAFAKKGDGKQARCRKCHSIYTKDNYLKNKAYYRDKADTSRTRQRDKKRDVMLDRFKAGCRDCENDDIRVLEFDHVHGIKEFGIADGIVNGVSHQRFLDEIAKCEVVCANCHKIRTVERAKSWRSKAHVYPNATNVLKG